MANFVRFWDHATIGAIEVTKEVKDLYAVGHSTAVQPLRIKIAATHSGKITRNNGFYLPSKMRDGAASWTAQYSKPIQVHHDEHSDPVGRVVLANYIDISRGIRDNWDAKKLVDDVRPISDSLLDAFVSGKLSFKESCDIADRYFIQDLTVSDDPDYHGLGYIELIADITDEKAITKVLDRRYLTGSVGASTDKAVCSVCKRDWAGDDGRCEHTPGSIYEDAKCVIIAGSLKYDEWSFVNKPADTHSAVIEVNTNGIQDFVKVHQFKDYVTPEIGVSIDLNSANSKEDTNMTFKDAIKIARKEHKDVKNLEDEVKTILDTLEEPTEETFLAALKDKFGVEEVVEEVKDTVDDSTNLLKSLLTLLNSASDEDKEKLAKQLLDEKTVPEEEVVLDTALEDKIKGLEDTIKDLETQLEDAKKNTELQDRLDAVQKENKYLHQDIDNLQDQLASQVEVNRTVKIEKLADLKQLSGEEVDLEKFTDSYKEVSIDDIDQQLKDISDKVDIHDIAGRLNSGLTNEPVEIVKDPTVVADNTKKEKIEKVITIEDLKQIEQSYMQLRMSRGQAVADMYLRNLKEQGVIPAEFPGDKS